MLDETRSVHEDELGAVIASYLEAADEGRPPAPADLLARHPHLADDLRAFLAAEQHLAEAAGAGAPGAGGPQTETLSTAGDRSIVADELPEVGAMFGEYELLEVIGEGGMGVVYKARHRRLKRVVALKLIHAGRHATRAERERFRVEAEAAARLSHPGIVQLYEVGEHDGQPFLASEFCGGGALAARLDGTPRPADVAARIVAELAAAVQAAHDHDILHRDLKPANVLLTEDARLKIGDFGLAKLLDQVEFLTQTNAILGSPPYMSPEQAAGQAAVGRATDVYALGAILYELLTGRPPFRGATPAETVQSVVRNEPAAPRRLNRAVPRDLQTICLRCLEKNPAKRFASATDLADDLNRFLRGEAIRSRPVGPLGRLWRWGRRNPKVALLTGLTALLLVVIAVGGVVLSVRLSTALGRANEDRDAARLAEREAKEKLLLSLVSEAKASRYSRRIGQRFDSLVAIRKASALARELDQPPAVFDELRNLAIAALALPDLQPTDRWVSEPTDPGWATTYYCDFDPRFRRAALSSTEGAVSVRRVGADPDDSAELARFPGFGGETLVRWAPDGRHLAVRHFLIKRLQVWKEEGSRFRLVLEEQNQCWDCDFSPDGQHLVSVGAGDIRVYHLERGEKVRSVAVQNPGQRFSAHHPQLSQIALCVRDGVQIVDLATGATVKRIPLPQTPAHVAWHPHGELLAITTDHQVLVRDASSGRQLHRLEHPGGHIHVSFNSSGDVLATSGWFGGLRLWNPYTGRLVFSTERTSAYPRFGPDGLLARVFSTGGQRSTGPVARFESAPIYRTLAVGAGRTGGWDYMSCGLHPDGRLLASGTGQGFGLMDLATGGERVFVPVPTTAVMFEPSGSLLTTTSAGLHRWPVRADPVHPNRFCVGPPELIPVRLRAIGGHLAHGADGQVLAAGSIDGGFVWHRDRPDAAIPLRPHGECRAVAVSPNGALVATGSQSGNELKVWDARTGTLIRAFPTGNYRTMPYFSPDGQWLMNRDGQTWRVADWSPGPRHPGERGVAFAPKMRLAAWGGHKGFVPLVDPDTGRELARLEDPHQDTLFGLAFSPDGAQLFGFTNDSYCVRVWDLRLLRAELQHLGLNWSAPPYPAAPSTPADPGLLQLELIGAGTLQPTTPPAPDKP